MSDFLTRRDVIKSGGMIAVGLVAPRWLATIAEADVIRQAKGGKAAGDTVLVVCQLSGGNDGLNTVVPFADPLYRKLRPQLGHSDDRVLKLNETLGLHPALSGLHELFMQGKVAIVQNVGYPRPNRSHFKSMEIWQTGGMEGPSKGGWIGRHFDRQAMHGPLNPVVALGLSTEKPMALTAKRASIPCFASLADVKNMIGDSDAERMLRDIQGMDAMSGTSTRAVQDASKTALDAISILKKQIGGYEQKTTYGNDSFGNGFKQIAQIVASSPTTRVVYFSAGGFDTHARQAETHEKLLTGLGNAVSTFQKEMESIGKAEKVVTLIFSEFGRRAFENGSGGTDHGAAAPMFIVGTRVKGGVHGPNPNLADLQDGDLKFTQDFRGIYSATLDQWMGGDSELVLGGKFETPPVF